MGRLLWSASYQMYLPKSSGVITSFDMKGKNQIGAGWDL